MAKVADLLPQTCKALVANASRGDLGTFGWGRGGGIVIVIRPRMSAGEWLKMTTPYRSFLFKTEAEVE